MASDYPASLDAFPDPLVNSPLNSPSHAALHQDVNDAVEKVQVKLGVGASDADDASDGQVLMADGSGGTEWASITADEIDSTGQPAQRVLASDGSGGAAWVSNETGLVKIASGTLSVTTSATNVTGVFSSNYKNYKLLLKVISRTVNPSRFSIRYIVGTTPTTVNYYQSGLGSDVAINAVVYYQRSNNDNQLFFESTGFSATYSFDIFSPNLAQPTSHSGHVSIGQQPYPYSVGGFNSPATQHTGFQLFSNSGTLAMEYQVFGYRD